MGDALVFDIGGTNLRAGRYSCNLQEVVDFRKIRTPNIWNTDTNGLPYKQLINSMAEFARQLFPDDAPQVVTIGFPGPITPGGDILSSPTICGSQFSGTKSLYFDLKTLWPGSKVNIINDVSAAGYFLKRIYADDFCVITVSSGIGSKLFVDGKPYTGLMGRGGEIGHWVTDSTADGLRCECGGKGHLASIASGRGCLAFAKSQAKLDPSSFQKSAPGKITNSNYEEITNEILVTSYLNDDKWTRAIINRTAKELAKVIALIHTIAGIEIFIIIGGFSIALGEPYRRALVKSAKEFCWNLGQDWDKMIKIGPKETELGLLGAGVFSENVGN